MYTRALSPPSKPFFLFGPLGTGKSTWLKERFPGAKRVDLLSRQVALEHEKDPLLLRREVLAQPKDRWIIVDEVQRVPALLDEVHFLIENEGYRRFALTGSSARKLKRGAANLLAGRAVLRKLFPLTAAETGFSVPEGRALEFGLLPASVDAESDTDRIDFLRSYVSTYLAEEIKAEGLVRNAGSFARFLEVFALVAGQRINASGLARDAGVSRDTVRSYLEIFEDTLIGSWLPAYRPRARVKEVAAPKFYWFDSGVLNAASGALQQPSPADWRGVLLEHWIHHELKSFMSYRGVSGSLGYWATPSGSEIDFLWWYGSKFVAIEVKASERFRPEYLKGIEAFREKYPGAACWIVYLGDRELKAGTTTVLPVAAFLKRLERGDVIPA